jgi:hypothetical protein
MRYQARCNDDRYVVRCKYQEPSIERILLDNEISLALGSDNPPSFFGENIAEVVAQQHHPLKSEIG